MKKLRFLSMCMAMCLLGTSLCCATTEADSSVVPNELEKKNAFIDIQHHWAANDIYTLTENHIINGFPNDRFKPSQTLTRAQLAQILYKLEGIRDNNDGVEIGSVEANEKIEGIIKDEIPTWASEAIEWAIINRVMFLYEDEEFKSDVHVDRAMIANAIYNYLKYTEYSFKELTPSVLTDIDDSVNKMAIETLYNEGIIHGYADNTYRPNNLVKRAEAAKLIRTISNLEVLECPVSIPTYNVIDVPYYSQVYPVSALVGCEGTSLFMGLKGKGYAQGLELYEFLDRLPRHSSNPAKGFVGSPFVPDKTKKTRTTIYPPKLTEYARQYGNVEDFSGASVEELRAEILAGNPVVAYCTMWWEEPFYRDYNIEGEIQSLLSNNHVILVCGYKAETNEYYIADPYNIKNIKEELRYWIDGYTFEKIYNERRHAVVIK